ncbi:Forkhead associated (FHA) domain, binds pSer, pThr, pTyr [Cellulosimicrobium aquatile]|uniref:Forkhead associated (FHA) domain, binds pSer, pThr, pTyr n=1 Tax=Cellulosimicrobium aquatile TaxID=1612203 RepID=A0A1N6PM18_9MICO|nr:MULTISPECIES: FHA domain-containing protein [Cellulosimicrobium]MCM3534972.1 FHA domain-containing protein [Cellulosimicrobium funkei]MDQ8042008.1 FHA domain-containing protein [Cellulosimicrobium sp. XJ-DQ-B-000]SIQ05371.1 Forkhead associated (FHA) domain, binds pSer, pThr, pTyr [Cellulosimicrobium aquatile]
MTDLTFTLLRLGYLVLLWVFVLSAIGVLRRDLYGTKITPRRGKKGAPAPAARPTSGPTPAAPEPSRPAAPAGPSRLVVTAGPLTGTTIPLTTSSILIGRAPSCTLVLDDDYSSSRHARIFPQHGSWFVEDLGSTNGTYVEDQRIAQVTPLGLGTRVRIGQSVVELQR